MEGRESMLMLVSKWEIILVNLSQCAILQAYLWFSSLQEMLFMQHTVSFAGTPTCPVSLSSDVIFPSEACQT